MADELISRRRRIEPEDLQRIRDLVLQEGARGRPCISRRLCHLWDWRQANGRFREIACRDLLRQLEARDFIKLPPMLHPARRPGYQNTVRAPEPLEQERPEGYLRDWCDRIELTPVQSPAQRQRFDGLIGAYHYLGYQQPTGAQLKYLATHEQRPIACLSFGPAAFKIAPRDQFIGWSARQREARLPWLVNNDRFLILPWLQVPHLASWLLSRCLRRLPRDWQQVCRQDLALVRLEKALPTARSREPAAWRTQRLAGAAASFVVFKIDRARGTEVLMRIPGEDFKGILGCDYDAAYRKYARQCSVLVQFCLAHLIGWICERLWTVMATCALHKRSPFQWIYQAISACFKGRPAPSLIPDTS